MNLGTTNRFLGLLFTVALMFGFSATVAFADHHEGDEEHSDAMHSEGDEAERIAQMQIIVTLLTQLLEILTAEAGGSAAHDHSSHDHDNHGDSNTLAVWVEIHSNRTHAHVDAPGAEVDTFFIDDHDYTEEAAIITAIAAETGLAESDIEAVIVFPAGEVDENGDSVEESGDDHDAHHEETGDEEDEHTDEADLAGLHIMGDGTIMLGDGTVLAEATITADGMVMLEDGDVVEPEFDLR